jgi:hypothetical protein
MLIALRIGAVVCLIAVGLTLSMTVFDDMSFTRGGGVVIRKYTTTSGSLVQFRLDCGLQSGGEYNSAYSRRFYDSAKVGDHLQFPLHGYTRLVRDGQTVGRDFSEDLIFPVAYSFIALLPSILFIRVDRLRYRRLLYGFAGVIEVAVIGLIAYSLFAPCC